MFCEYLKWLLLVWLQPSSVDCFPGDDEADKVVDPPLEDLDESPLGPPGVPRSKRRGEGGEIAGVEETDVVALFVEGVLVADVIKARVDERFFWAFSGTLAKTIH